MATEREKVYIVFDGDFDSSIEGVFRSKEDAERFMLELQIELDKKIQSIRQKAYMYEEELR